MKRTLLRIGALVAALALLFIPVLAGIHDSSANFYRYQAAGLSDMTVVSTGTWIVGLSDSFDPAALSEARGMTCNADVHGRPVPGMGKPRSWARRNWRKRASRRRDGGMTKPSTDSRSYKLDTLAS